MIDDPKRTYKELKEINKVYEAYLFILNRYTFGIKDITLKDSLTKHFKGDSWDEINIAIKVAMNEYDPFLYQLHNAILEYEKSNEEYFNCQKYREQLSCVIEKCEKDIDRVRQEEIHDMLTIKKSTGMPEYIQKMIDAGLLYPDGIRVQKRLGDIINFLEANNIEPTIQFICETFHKKNGKPYSKKTIDNELEAAHAK